LGSSNLVFTESNKAYDIGYAISLAGSGLLLPIFPDKYLASYSISTFCISISFPILSIFSLLLEIALAVSFYFSIDFYAFLFKAIAESNASLALSKLLLAKLYFYLIIFFFFLSYI